MARARNIKPGLFRDEEMIELPIAARYLFIGLWTMADRRGRLEDRPKKIRIELLPYDDVDVDAMLDALQDKGFLIRYGSGQERYIQIRNFEKHQNPHKNEAESELPGPEDVVPCLDDSRNVPKPSRNGDATRADSLIPDSLIPDPLESIDSISSASDETETEAQSPPRKTERPRNPWFEKLAECWLGKPYGELTLTKPQEKLCGMAASELKRINAPPEQIPEEWARISKQYENITPAAIPKHWNANGTGPRVLTAEDVYRIAE